MYIFLIRIALGTIFAVGIGKVFFPDTSSFKTAGLGIFLIGMAYVLEYFHMKKEKSDPPK